MIAALFTAEKAVAWNVFYFIDGQGWDAVETMPLASRTRPVKQQ